MDTDGESRNPIVLVVVLVLVIEAGEIEDEDENENEDENFRRQPAEAKRSAFPGSAGVSPAVCGLWPQTFCRSQKELFGSSFIREDQPARRRLERPGRSRSPFRTLKRTI
jgi:hypothetical protein